MIFTAESVMFERRTLGSKNAIAGGIDVILCKENGMTSVSVDNVVGGRYSRRHGDQCKKKFCENLVLET